MRPAVFEAAAPLAYVCAGASRHFQSAFVARRFNDDMIAGTSKRVIKDKDAFFGCGHDKDIVGLHSAINSGDDFTQCGRSRRFGIAAPMLKESFVRTRLE